MMQRKHKPITLDLNLQDRVVPLNLLFAQLAMHGVPSVPVSEAKVA